jgi:hypothetical protein
MIRVRPVGLLTCILARTPQTCHETICPLFSGLASSAGQYKEPQDTLTGPLPALFIRSTLDVQSAKYDAFIYTEKISSYFRRWNVYASYCLPSGCVGN